jgi:hypothetical protein
VYIALARAYDGTTSRTTKGPIMSMNPTTREDLAYVAFMDAQFGEEQIDAMNREAYERWAEAQRDELEDDSEEAYLAYLEMALPDD